MSERKKGRPYRRNRAAVLARSDVCWLCGKPGADTVDHIVPYSLGGGHEVANLAPAHLACNVRRGNGAARNAQRNSTSRRW